MGTVVGAWRLRAIIILFLMLMTIYIVNGFLFTVPTDEYGYIIDETNITENDTAGGLSSSQGFQDLIFGLGSFITFGNVDNSYARLFLNLVTTICFVSIGYITYTFIKEWIPFT